MIVTNSVPITTVAAAAAVVVVFVVVEVNSRYFLLGFPMNIFNKVEAVLAIDAPNQVISHVIVPNLIIVVAMVAHLIKQMMMMAIEILNDKNKYFKKKIVHTVFKHSIKRLIFLFSLSSSSSFYSRHIDRSFPLVYSSI